MVRREMKSATYALLRKLLLLRGQRLFIYTLVAINYIYVLFVSLTIMFWDALLFFLFIKL